MAEVTRLYCALLLSLFTCIPVFCLNIRTEPNKTDFIFASGDNFNLTCEDDDYVEWTYDEFTYHGTEELFRKDNVFIEDDTDEGTYISKLLIYSASETDIGTYTCVSRKNSSDDGSSKSIYVYVYDNKTLLFWDRLMRYNNTEFMDLTIPCRPTLPNITPRLNVSVFEENENPRATSNITSTFDENKGFSVKRILFNDCRNCPQQCPIFLKVKFSCYTENFNISQVVQIFCRRISLEINETGAYFPVEGSSVSLNCSATDTFFKHYPSLWKGFSTSMENLPFNWTEFSISWKLPNDTRGQNIEESDLMMTDEDGNLSPSRILTISNASKFNQGEYKCEVDDLLSTYRETPVAYFLPIWDKNDIFVYITTIDGGEEITDYVGDNVSWKFNVTANSRPELKWKQENNSYHNVPNDEKHSLSFDGRYAKLEIRNTSKADQGSYSLIAFNKYEANVVNLILRVRDLGNKNYVNFTITEGNKTDTVNVTKGTEKSYTWTVAINANPRACVTWYNPKNKEINSAGDKYSVITSDEFKTMLQINRIEMADSGTYYLEANNGADKKGLNLTLHVQDIPKVDFKKDRLKLYYLNDPYTVECAVTAVPKPEIKLFSMDCKDFQECNSQSFVVSLIEDKTLPRGENEYEWKISHRFDRADHSRKVYCYAKNDLGVSKNVSALYLVTDIEDPARLNISVTPEETVVSDVIHITCMASKYYYYENGTWSYSNNGRDFISIKHRDPGLSQETVTKEFSHQFKLTISNANKSHTGYYRCQVWRYQNMTVGNESTMYKDVGTNITVQDIEEIKLTADFGDENQTLSEGNKTVKLQCYATGVPKPEITWYLNNSTIKESNRTHIKEDNHQTLTIEDVVPKQDNGLYKCTASNRLHRNDSKSYDKYLRFSILQPEKDTSNQSPPMYSVVGIILLGSVIIIIVISGICIALLAWRIQKEKKFRRELADIGLVSFERGAADSLNPELHIQAQADLLPYDRRFEFPRKNLKFGKQLGAGAFGMVMKAEAIGLRPKNEITIVAVKMVQQRADLFQVKALASELKIMIYLGNHVNVVNLLGACTRNIDKRQLCVIVEYCKYGNLRDFLLKNRNNFTDQIDRKTDQIDYSITDSSGEDVPTATNENFVEGFKIDSTGYIITQDSNSDEEDLNYCQGDYEDGTIIPPIKTTDLICWSFQIARGMEFLASRKVLHGDLAARNILLADNNVVKICDFGLAKNMYYSDNYRSKDSALLPVRWLAVESIRDRVFSVQSDIWSFGITMWELFSLSVIPYPDVQKVDTLYEKLAAGYRLEKPEYATNQIHRIMLNCWHERPTLRPTFHDLSERLGKLLENHVRAYYIRLNDAFTEEHSKKDHSVDYLALLHDPIYTEAKELQYKHLPRISEHSGEGEKSPKKSEEAGKKRKFSRMVSQFMENFELKTPHANTEQE